MRATAFLSLMLVAPVVGQTRPKVRSHISIFNLNGEESVVYSTERLFEAPNWSPDGKYLLLNSGGKL